MKKILVLAVVLMLAGCGSSPIDTEGLTPAQKMEIAEKLIEATTVPGTDKRCYAGFCRERTRTVDVEGWAKWLELKKQIDAGEFVDE